MRANSSAQAACLNAATPKSTPRPGDYLVSPILVNDLWTQCAAHFLTWFSGHPLDHLRGVLKCGVHKSGGLVEEIEYWMQQCESDATSPGNPLGYWETAENGPWIYQGVPAVDVAKAVKRHTRGWVAKDFAFYGYTVAEKADVEAFIRATT
jgi:hypothetical protein